MLATCKLASETLTLVPWSQSVRDKPLERTAAKEANVYVEVMTKPSVVFGISPPAGLGKKVDCEFWRMHEEKKDQKLANMYWGFVTEKVSWPINGMAGQVEVRISCVTNHKDIEPNHELIVYTKKFFSWYVFDDHTSICSGAMYVGAHLHRRQAAHVHRQWLAPGIVVPSPSWLQVPRPRVTALLAPSAFALAAPGAALPIPCAAHSAPGVLLLAPSDLLLTPCVAAFLP